MVDLKLYIFLGAVLFLGLVESSKIQKRASELSDAFKGRDVNKTIAKVEAILAKNPALPRLTRGEILALFENITKADASKMPDPLKTMLEGGSTQDKEKTLMVVLPLSANDSENKNIEELYTHPPITRIVGENYTPISPTAATTTTERPKRPKKRKNGNRRKPMNQEIRPVYVEEKSTTASPQGENINWNPSKTENANNLGFQVPQEMKNTLDTFQNANNQVFVTLPPSFTTKNHQPTTASTTSSPIPNFAMAAQSLTPELKNLLISLGLLNSDGTPVATSTTTTTTTARPPPPLIQYISINPTVDPKSYIVFKPLPVTSSRGTQRGKSDEPLSDDMRHFLASFGLTSDSDNFRSQKAIVEVKERLTTERASTASVSTTEKPTEILNDSVIDDSGLPDINTDALTDDMKFVLEDIGLMKKTTRKSKGVIFNPAMRTAGLLNQSEEKEKVSKLLSTIKELSAAEKNKSLSAEEVAEQLQNITSKLNEEDKEDEDLEIVEGEGSEMNYEGYEPAEEELLKLQNGFVDDDLKDDPPLDTSNSNTKNKSKDISSNVFPGSSSFYNIPSSLNLSLKDSQNAPDPLSSDELHQFIENNKNEIKRQQPNKRQQPDNTTESSNEPSSTTEAPSSTEGSSDDDKSSSDEPSDASPSDTDTAAAGNTDDSTPSTDDLIDSFGGETPTENRPNGLYFLVDWNTFLRVGTDNKTVDLNFAPKVGDPKNFLPITVP